MPETREILLVTLLPALVSAMVLIAGMWMARRGNGAWAGPLSVGAGFATGYFAYERPGFPPQAAFDWLAFATIGITLMGVVIALLRVPRWLAALLGLLMS